MVRWGRRSVGFLQETKYGTVDGGRFYYDPVKEEWAFVKDGHMTRPVPDPTGPPTGPHGPPEPTGPPTGPHGLPDPTGPPDPTGQHDQQPEQHPHNQQLQPQAALEDPRLTAFIEEQTAFMEEQKAFMQQQKAQWHTQHQLNQEIEQKELALEKQTQLDLNNYIEEEHTTQKQYQEVLQKYDSLEDRVNQLDSAVKEHDVHALLSLIHI